MVEAGLLETRVDEVHMAYSGVVVSFAHITRSFVAFFSIFSPNDEAPITPAVGRFPMPATTLSNSGLTVFGPDHDSWAHRVVLRYLKFAFRCSAFYRTASVQI